MKTIKHEIKLERSVKIILAVFALGIFLNAFATPISKEVFGIKEVKAGMSGSGTAVSPIHIVCQGGTCN